MPRFSVLFFNLFHGGRLKTFGLLKMNFREEWQFAEVECDAVALGHSHTLCVACGNFRIAIIHNNKTDIIHVHSLAMVQRGDFHSRSAASAKKW